ncbi:hypothetical protein Bbelb_158360 [Branchiostoma belcheri]|nr:hypothetical protein Bbelb_158360 [Branchiostoma belcheri]
MEHGTPRHGMRKHHDRIFVSATKTESHIELEELEEKCDLHRHGWTDLGIGIARKCHRDRGHAASCLPSRRLISSQSRVGNWDIPYPPPRATDRCDRPRDSTGDATRTVDTRLAVSLFAA